MNKDRFDYDPELRAWLEEHNARPLTTCIQGASAIHKVLMDNGVIVVLEDFGPERGWFVYVEVASPERAQDALDIRNELFKLRHPKPKRQDGVSHPF